MDLGLKNKQSNLLNLNNYEEWGSGGLEWQRGTFIMVTNCTGLAIESHSNRDHVWIRLLTQRNSQSYPHYCQDVSATTWMILEFGWFGGTSRSIDWLFFFVFSFPNTLVSIAGFKKAWPDHCRSNLQEVDVGTKKYPQGFTLHALVLLKEWCQTFFC